MVSLAILAWLGVVSGSKHAAAAACLGLSLATGMLLWSAIQTGEIMVSLRHCSFELRREATPILFLCAVGLEAMGSVMLAVLAIVLLIW